MRRSIDQLTTILKKLPGIFTVNITGGDYTVAFGVQVRHPHDISLVLDALCSRAGLSFESRSVAIRTDLKLFHRKYLSSHEAKQKSFYITSTVHPVELDQTDRAILAALNDAPLASFRDIARATKVAESTVIYRFNALCAAGVIVGFGLSIDGTDIDMHTFRIVIRAANPTLALHDAIYAFAARHPHVLSCSSFVGDWDYFLRVEVESPLDVFGITQDLARTVSPHRIEMAVVPVLREIHFKRQTP
jgi:DNA-binding Lrp family transcriptional regulator